MSYLCRNCGNKINFRYEDKPVQCTGCLKEITRKDTIAEWTLEARVAQLKAMHELMLNVNDEEIYMTWIVTGVPDEPSDTDFEDIALDDEMYNECFDLFVDLIKYKGNRW